MSEFNDKREERREERRKRWEERMRRWEERRNYRGYGRGGRGHIWTGLFLLLVGVAALLKASVTDLPDWIFSWQVFLIALGLFIGVRHRFHGGIWLFMIMIGGFFLYREFNPDFPANRYVWPLVLIFFGIFIILRSRRLPPGEKKNAGLTTDTPPQREKEAASKNDFVDSTSVFGGAKKNILSKDFKGGDIVNFFGGTELNLMQADINGKVPLELTTVFGGTKLIIPSNWSVQSEVVTVFGGLEDKRPIPASPEATDKVLVLRGTVIFGGIEIKSF